MTTDDWLKVLPSLLVVGGWVVVYRLQALQARRKALREEAEKARAAVETLREAAVRFHLAEYSSAARFALLTAITDVERRCEIFPKIAQSRVWYVPNAVAPKKVRVDPLLIVAVRQAITLHHFDDPEGKAIESGAPQIRSIGDACHSLVRAIDDVLVAALD